MNYILYSVCFNTKTIFFDYNAEHMKNIEMSPRNSQLREYAQQPLSAVAKLLHTHLPWLTPNEVTILGTASLGAFTLYVSSLEKQNKIDFTTGIRLIGTYAALSATDALDGSLARYKKSQGDMNHDSSTGQLVDSLSDRVQEAFLAWLAMYRAAEQGDKLWFFTSTLTALTNPLSSLVRAWAESKGIAVPESGTSAFEFFGTRAGRAAAGAATMMPTTEIVGIKPQTVISGLTAAATTKTTLSRLNTIRTAEPEHHVLDDATQADAKKRVRLLGGLAVVTASITGMLTYKLLSDTEKRGK